jgi:ABC-type Fe3+ transport system permease subunit
MNPELHSYQQKQDEDQLRLLTILFRVYAALCAFGSLFTFIYIGIGMMMINHPEAMSKPGEAPPPPGLGAMFVTIGVVGFILLIAAGIFCLCAANWIRDRRQWMGIIVLSAIICLNMPLGTGLGVFTIVVLNRPSVRSLFSPQ